MPVIFVCVTKFYRIWLQVSSEISQDAVLGRVVQSIVSLTSSLRGQLVKCFMTL